MSSQCKVRYGWLKFLYLYTLVGAGGSGLLMILFPDRLAALFGMPAQDPYIYGVAASIWLAFGLLSILGLRAPVAFLPVLLMQLFYKSIWLVAVVLPLMLRGERPAYAFLFTAIMVSYVVLDLIAIPFGILFGRPGPEQEAASVRQ